MSGIYGASRAFNLKFRPNGPSKVFITDRRPIFNFFGGCRGPQNYGGANFLYGTNTYMEYKPSVWENIGSIISSLTSGFCMLGSMGIIGGSKNTEGVDGKPKPQGATSEDDGQNLKRLQMLAKGKNISVVPEEGGKFTLMKGDKNLVDATYEDARDWILDYNSNQTSTPGKTSTPKVTSTPKRTSTPTVLSTPDEESTPEVTSTPASTVSSRASKTRKSSQSVDEARKAAEAKKIEEARKRAETYKVKQTEKAKPLTQAEKQNAENAGRQVAMITNGPTLNGEKAKRIISSTVTPRNVKAFLDGYDKSKSATADSFFTQIQGEWTISNRDAVCKSVANNLVEYCRNTGQSGLANQITRYIKDGNYEAIDRLLPQIKSNYE